jgi:hypothetical protein
MADTPNSFSVEFQDSFNEYQQDSLSLIDVADVAQTGQQITGPFSVLGIPNYDQAARALKFNLDRSIQGNTYVEFETSVRAIGIQPGDLISLTYLKEGFNRQPFRVIGIAPEPITGPRLSRRKFTMTPGTAILTARRPRTAGGNPVRVWDYRGR